MLNKIEIKKASFYSIPIIINIRLVARIKQYIEQYPELSERDFTKSEKEIKQNIAVIRKLMRSSDNLWLTAKNKNKIVGFIRVRKDNQNIGHISALFVLPQTQGLGIGSKLLQKALLWLKDTDEVRLAVVEKNVTAIKFYEKHGFKQTSEQGKPFNINGKKSVNRIIMSKKH